MSESTEGHQPASSAQRARASAMPSAQQMRAATELGALTRPQDQEPAKRRPPPKPLLIPRPLLLSSDEEPLATFNTSFGQVQLAVEDLPEVIATAREALAAGTSQPGHELWQEVLERAEAERAALEECAARRRMAPQLHDLVVPGAADATLLKLAMLLLWIGHHQADNALPQIPAGVYAEALGLSDPATRGARRVRNAEKRLAELNMLTRTPRRPRPPELRLIDHNSSGPDPTDHAEVPPTLFTNGWIAALSGPALLVLIHVIAQRLGRQRGHPNATELRSRSNLSKAAWYLGVNELLHYGLLSRRRLDQSTLADRYFGRQRYEFLREGLGRAATQRAVAQWRAQRSYETGTPRT